MMEVLEKLKDDDLYYGEFGRKYLSNSDIGTLLNNPKMFKKAITPTLPMLLGRYLHTLMLEPDKISDFIVCDATTRTTKIYKEVLLESAQGIIILKKEVEDMVFLADQIKQNVFLNEIIYEKGNKFEQPAITEIDGIKWKGKADIVTQDLILDIKTSSRIDDFKYSARKYNYDSQAWLYSQLFGRPMMFVVVDKATGRLGLYDCCEEFLDRGREKVYQAMEVYNTFFGENPTEDIDQFFINQTL